MSTWARKEPPSLRSSLQCLSKSSLPRPPKLLLDLVSVVGEEFLQLAAATRGGSVDVGGDFAVLGFVDFLVDCADGAVEGGAGEEAGC